MSNIYSHYSSSMLMVLFLLPIISSCYSTEKYPKTQKGIFDETFRSLQVNESFNIIDKSKMNCPKGFTEKKQINSDNFHCTHEKHGDASTITIVFGEADNEIKRINYQMTREAPCPQGDGSLEASLVMDQILEAKQTNRGSSVIGKVGSFFVREDCDKRIRFKWRYITKTKN